MIRVVLLYIYNKHRIVRLDNLKCCMLQDQFLYCTHHNLTILLRRYHMQKKLKTDICLRWYYHYIHWDQPELEHSIFRVFHNIL